MRQTMMVFDSPATTAIRPRSNKKPTQCDRILERLRRGIATNVDFVEMRILRYGARIYELRKQGYEIIEHPGQYGVNTYELIAEKKLHSAAKTKSLTQA